MLNRTPELLGLRHDLPGGSDRLVAMLKVHGVKVFNDV